MENFINNIKDQSKKLITKDISKCFDFLEQHINRESKKYNELILIKAGYSHNEKLFNLNLSNNNQINIDLNKNRLAILNFIDDLENEDITLLKKEIKKSDNLNFQANLERIEFYRNPIDDHWKFMVREIYNTNLSHLEKIIRVQIKDSDPEISILDSIDSNGNYVFQYLAVEDIAISRKLVLIRLNGEASNLFYCSPILANSEINDNNIPKLRKIEY